MTNLIQHYRQKLGTFNIDDYTHNSEGCVLWLKADAYVFKDFLTTLASDGDSVEAWDGQQSIRNYDYVLQQTPNFRPIYHTNALNGLPIISFTKENFHSMYTTQLRSKFDILNPSIFSVVRWHAGAGFLYGKCGGTGGGSTPSWYKMSVFVPDSTHCFWSAGADNQSGSGAISAAMTNWNILSPIVRNEKNINININGVDNIMPNTANRKDNHSFNTNPFMLGEGFLTGFGWTTMDIAEIIVLNYEAPTWLKQKIINYLSTKWGIGVTNTVPDDLPSSRPLVGSRPAA